jgi:hypothetical protein
MKKLLIMIHVICILLLLFFLTGCKKTELKSRWKDREIHIDGDITDWQNALIIDEKKNVSIGLFNDNDFLYLCLTTMDRLLIRQVRGMGFIVWFDPDGGKDKTFGIKFPLGVMSDKTKTDDIDYTKFQSRFETSLSELEIIGPEKDSINRMAFSEIYALGVEITADLSNERFIYELKIPLLQNEQHEYAIDIKQNNIIEICFETPEIGFEEEMWSGMRKGMWGQRDGMDGGMRGRGMNGEMHGEGMRDRKLGMGYRPGSSNPFMMWTKVELGLKE